MTNFESIDFNNKVTLLRADFNVPFSNGVIQDNNRIVQALPTIKHILNHGGKLVIMSHLGKIKHKEEPSVLEASKKKNNLKIVVPELSSLLGLEVKFCESTKGEELETEIKELKAGEVLLVQNSRYEKGEEKNDEELSKYYASLFDVYVNDAFGTCHRKHVTTYGIPYFMKQEGKPVTYGFLVAKEVEMLNKCCKNVQRPFVAVLGGAKVSSKIKVIERLLDKADCIIIGGGMSYTFKKALGNEVGNSLVEDDQLEFARECLAKANGRIILPVDNIVATGIDAETGTLVEDIPSDLEGVDIGEESIKLFTEKLQGAKTIFWNGPMGVFENKAFELGTKSICEAISKLKDCFTIIGGGDSASAAKMFGFEEKFSHVSTGGGASLEMIENDGTLPCIELIEE